MPNPITGTLTRSIALYPFPGEGDEIIHSGGGVFDASGDVYFFTIYRQDGTVSVVSKYVYSTDTLTPRFAMLPAPVTAMTALKWNSDRSKLIGLYVGDGSTQFYEIDPATGAVATLGLLADHQLIDLAPDGAGGYIGKAFSGQTFYSVDIAAGTVTELFTLPRFCAPFEVTSDAIYTASAPDAPGYGPMIRLHRNLGHLSEFLAGSRDSTAPLLATNPDYAAFKLYLAEVCSRGNTLYMLHNTGLEWQLLAFDKTTRSVARLVAPFPVNRFDNAPNLGATDDGSRVVCNGGLSGLAFFS